jgi:hypothetical protein
MTLGVAGAAGLAALLGGFFGGTGPWEIGRDLGNIALGNFLSNTAIVLAFIGYLACVLFSTFAAERAISIIRDLGKAPTGLVAEKRFGVFWHRGASYALGAALVFSLLLIVANLVAYQIR